jgi:hypothetical protein
VTRVLACARVEVRGTAVRRGDPEAGTGAAEVLPTVVPAEGSAAARTAVVEGASAAVVVLTAVAVEGLREVGALTSSLRIVESTLRCLSSPWQERP